MPDRPTTEIPWEREFPIVEITPAMLASATPPGAYSVLLPGASVVLRIGPKIKPAIKAGWALFVNKGRTVGCVGCYVRSYSSPSFRRPAPREEVLIAEFRGLERASFEPPEGAKLPRACKIVPLTDAESVAEDSPEVARLQRAITRTIRSTEHNAMRKSWRQVSRLSDLEHRILAVIELAAGTGTERDRYLDANSLQERLLVAGATLEAYLASRRAEEKTAWEVPPAASYPDLKSHTVWRRQLRGSMTATCPRGTSHSHPLHADGVLYVSVFSPGVIRAVHANSGRVIWSRRVGKYPDPPVLVAGILLVASGGFLWAILATTGNVLWRFRYRESHSSPTIHGCRVYLGDGHGTMHCLDVGGNGTPIWSSWLPKAPSNNNYIQSTPAMVRGRLVCVCNDGHAYGLNPDSGQVTWRTELDGNSIWEVGILIGAAVVKTSNSIYLLDPENGVIEQRLSWPGWKVGALCVAGSRLVVSLENCDDEDEHKLLAIKEGEEEWSRPGWRFTSAMRWEAATQLIYEASITGLSILDPVTGVRQASYAGGRLLMPDLPSVVDDRLYLLDSNGYLYALSHPR